MKKIYRRIGLLILATILIVGCSSENLETNQTEEPMQLEEIIVDKEELDELDAVEEVEDREEFDEAERAEKVEESDEVEEIEEAEKSDKVDEVAKEPGPQVKSKVLRNIMETKRYTIKMNMYSRDEDFRWSVTTVVADGNTVTTMFLVDSIFKTIEIEDKSYAIMEDTKVIIVSDRYEEGEIENPSSDIIYNDLLYIGEGKDLFLGNQRSFEEYKTEKGRIRYYFNENQLDGMELFLDREGQLEDENININQANIIMDVEFFTEEVDMSVFELPEAYKIVEE